MKGIFVNGLLLKAEINAVKKQGSNLAQTSIENVGGADLPTCNGYRKRLNELRKTIILLGVLINKDMSEIETFISNMETQDNS